MGGINSKHSLNISTATKKNGDINGHAGKDVSPDGKITVIKYMMRANVLKEGFYDFVTTI